MAPKQFSKFFVVVKVEFLEEEGAGSFEQLQSTMTQITQVTKEFFEKLAGELELGLAGLTDRYTKSLEADGSLPL